MTKKKDKIRQRKNIKKGTKFEPNDIDAKKRKKHIRKPKMPARIKKTPREKQK